ncbi:MAG: hypothetical protein PHE49_11290 [bacterium]|nr:hypothetical protein [bacterium]
MGEELIFVTGAIALPLLNTGDILLPAVPNYQAIQKQEKGSSAVHPTMSLEKM